MSDFQVILATRTQIEEANPGPLVVEVDDLTTSPWDGPLREASCLGTPWDGPIREAREQQSGGWQEEQAALVTGGSVSRTTRFPEDGKRSRLLCEWRISK